MIGALVASPERLPLCLYRSPRSREVRSPCGADSRGSDFEGCDGGGGGCAARSCGWLTGGGGGAASRTRAGRSCGRYAGGGGRGSRTGGRAACGGAHPLLRCGARPLPARRGLISLGGARGVAAWGGGSSVRGGGGPPFALIASTCLSNGTGARGGFVVATTVRLSTAGGGCGTARSAPAPSTA